MPYVDSIEPVISTSYALNYYVKYGLIELSADIEAQSSDFAFAEGHSPNNALHKCSFISTTSFQEHI